MPDFCGSSEAVLLGTPAVEVEEVGAFSFDGNKLLSFPMTPALGADSLDLGLF